MTAKCVSQMSSNPAKKCKCRDMQTRVTFFCTTGSGRDGRVAGRRLKKMSFSLESLTARDSRNAIVSTSLVLSAALSETLAGFNLLTDCEARSR